MYYLITLLFSLLLVYLPLSFYGQEADTLKIASWNIEHLRAENNECAVRRKNSDYARLRKYAEWLNADVIALQEVEGSAAASRIFDDAKYNFFFSAHNNVMLTGFALKKPKP